MRAVESWRRPGEAQEWDLMDIDVKTLKKMTGKKYPYKIKKGKSIS